MGERSTYVVRAYLSAKDGVLSNHDDKERMTDPADFEMEVIESRADASSSKLPSWMPK